MSATRASLPVGLLPRAAAFLVALLLAGCLNGEPDGEISGLPTPGDPGAACRVTEPVRATPPDDPAVSGPPVPGYNKESISRL